MEAEADREPPQTADKHTNKQNIKLLLQSYPLSHFHRYGTPKNHAVL